MANFKFVMVSKDDRFSLTREDFFGISDLGNNIGSIFVKNNSEFITKIYNRHIDSARNDGTDFLVLLHADVKFDIQHLVEHVIECKDKYDVMGLCGCAKFSTSQTPLNWFCGSRPFPEHRWGCVTHGELGNTMSFFSSHHPDITDHEVACIDGLCIIFTRRALENESLRFCEKLGFDCYDTAISMEVVMKQRMKLGVLVEKSLHHYSVGKSILTEGFKNSERILREEYGLSNTVRK